MSSTDDASISYPLRNDPGVSALMANMPPSFVNSLLAPAIVTGRIREYAQVGDGVHLRQQQQLQPLALLPLMESAQSRPQTLVRKVSVVGSHVLRYVGRHSNVGVRRQLMRNLNRLRTSSLDTQPVQRENASHNDRANDVSWLQEDAEPGMASSLVLRIQPESYAVRLMLPSSSEDSSFLGLFNWKIYLGMLCIIAVQALLKLAYQEMVSMS